MRKIRAERIRGGSGGVGGVGAVNVKIQKNYAGRGDYYAHLDDESKKWESLGTESARETFRFSYENGNRCARALVIQFRLVHIFLHFLAGSFFHSFALGNVFLSLRRQF